MSTILLPGLLGALAVGGLGCAVAGARQPSRQPALSASPTARPTAAPGWFVDLCAELGLIADPPSAWPAVRAAAGCGVLAAAVLVGWPAAAAVAATALIAPRTARPVLARRRLARRDEQVVVLLESLASAIRSGQAPTTAIIGAADWCPDPLGTEVRTMAEELRHGAGLHATLARWAALPTTSGDVRLAAAAIILGARAGGEVAHAVDRVAATLRERRELRGEVRALATQARASAGLLIAAPVAFAALVATIEPTAAAFLVTTPVGVVCLVAGVALEVAGGLWMAHIVRSAG